MNKVLSGLVLLCFSYIVYGDIAKDLYGETAGYIRDLSKNVEKEEPDAFLYNPAGAAFIEDGIYFSLSNTITYSEESQKTLEENLEFNGIVEDYFNPFLFVTYKKDTYAFSFGIYAPESSHSLTYSDGSISSYGLSDYSPSVEIDSTSNAEILNFAIKLTDNWAFSSSLLIYNRYVEKTIKTKNQIPFLNNTTEPLNIAFRVSKAAFVWGTHLNLFDFIDLSAFIMPHTYSDYHYTKKDGALAELSKDSGGYGLSEIDRYRTEFQRVVGFGIGLHIKKDLYLDFGINYFYHKHLDNRKLKNYYNSDEDLLKFYEIMFGLEYDASDYFEISLSLLSSEQYSDIKSRIEDPENVYLNSKTLGFGFQYKFSESYLLDVGFAYAVFKESNKVYSGISLVFDRVTYKGAIGFTYKY